MERFVHIKRLTHRNACYIPEVSILQSLLWEFKSNILKQCIHLMMQPISQYMPSNGRNEWSGKNVERSGSGRIWGDSPEFAWENWECREKPKLGRVGHGSGLDSNLASPEYRPEGLILRMYPLPVALPCDCRPRTSFCVRWLKRKNMTQCVQTWSVVIKIWTLCHIILYTESFGEV